MNGELDQTLAVGEYGLVSVQVQILVLDLSGPTPLRFGLKTFLGPDSVRV